MATISDSRRQRLKRNRAKRITIAIDFLCERFPLCFFSDPEKIRPLSIGTQQKIFDILENEELPEGVTYSRIKMGLYAYCNAPAYRKLKAKVGVVRIDLEGKESGAVTEEETRLHKEAVKRIFSARKIQQRKAAEKAKAEKAKKEANAAEDNKPAAAKNKPAAKKQDKQVKQTKKTQQKPANTKEQGNTATKPTNTKPTKPNKPAKRQNKSANVFMRKKRSPSSPSTRTDALQEPMQPLIDSEKASNAAAPKVVFKKRRTLSVK